MSAEGTAPARSGDTPASISHDLLRSPTISRVYLLQVGANLDTQRARAALGLRAESRWAVTGPPASLAARRRRVPHEALLELIGLDGAEARTAHAAAALVRGFPGAERGLAVPRAAAGPVGGRGRAAGRAGAQLEARWSEDPDDPVEEEDDEDDDEDDDVLFE